jgi:hypothetical protein
MKLTLHGTLSYIEHSNARHARQSLRKGAAISEQHHALSDLQIYRGDGASHRNSLLRIEDGMLYGHAPLFDQLHWCAQQRVPRIVVSHCGKEIIADENRVAHQLQSNASKLGIQASIAYDGMTLLLPSEEDTTCH